MYLPLLVLSREVRVATPPHPPPHFLNVAVTPLKFSLTQAWVCVAPEEEELGSQGDCLTDPRPMGGGRSCKPTSPYRVLEGQALTRSEGPWRKQLAPGGKHMARRGWGQKEDQGR